MYKLVIQSVWYVTCWVSENLFQFICFRINKRSLFSLKKRHGKRRNDQRVTFGTFKIFLPRFRMYSILYVTDFSELDLVNTITMMTIISCVQLNRPHDSRHRLKYGTPYADLRVYKIIAIYVIHMMYTQDITK